MVHLWTSYISDIDPDYQEQVNQAARELNTDGFFVRYLISYYEAFRAMNQES